MFLETHGHAGGKTPRSKTYHVWAAMVQRCTNPRNKNFMQYGARGITVCARWRNFSNFLADMGEKPEGLTLDRKNNDEGYTPENCRWTTRREQALNRRPFSDQHKAALSKAFSGKSKNHSPEHRAYLAQQCRERNQRRKALHHGD